MFVRHSVLALALATTAACGSDLPKPRFGRQPTSALVRVPFAPPPARVEILPDRPADDAVWIDGEWSWRGGRWRWIRGRWTRMPDGALYCPWAWARGRDGTIYMAKGRFCDDKGDDVPGPRPLALAADVGGSVVDPEGSIVETGRALPPKLDKRGTQRILEERGNAAAPPSDEKKGDVKNGDAMKSGVPEDETRGETLGQ